MRLVAKHTQVGYEGPQERTACRNCKSIDLVDDDRPGFASRLRCKLHELEVNGGGICPAYTQGTDWTRSVQPKRSRPSPVWGIVNWREVQ